MNSADTKIIDMESSRLESLGIPYDHIHCSDGKPIVTVDQETMKSIIAMRDDGQTVSGLFISHTGKDWMASMTDKSGNPQHMSGLTECKAYRWVLGYPIGHSARHSRYLGQPCYKRSRKTRRKTNVSKS